MSERIRYAGFSEKAKSIGKRKRFICPDPGNDFISLLCLYLQMTVRTWDAGKNHEL